MINGTNSLINGIMGEAKQPEPEVGMGATRLLWTDRVPCTVVEVLKGGKLVVVQEDHAERTDSRGLSESQEYRYSPNPAGRLHRYSKRKNGAYVREGDTLKGGERILLGVREKYYDPSF